MAMYRSNIQPVPQQPRLQARPSPFASRLQLPPTTVRRPPAYNMRGRQYSRRGQQLGNAAMTAKLRNLRARGNMFGGNRIARGQPAPSRGMDRAQPFQQARARLSGHMGGARPAAAGMDRNAYSTNAATQAASQRQGAQGNSMRAAPFVRTRRGV